MSLHTPAPLSPAFLHFHRHFSIDPSRKSFPSDSSWTILPSGAVINSSEFPSPGSSEYHLPLSKRPKSAGMSRLTARENQRLHAQFEQFTAAIRPKAIVQDPGLTAKTPSERDFQRVIEKLQKVQSGNFACRRVILTEDKVESCVLEPGEVQYLKVSTAHKPTPLKVYLKRTQGKTVVYVSKSVSEPSELLSDGVFYKDYIEVSDGGMRFKTESVFLALKALVAATVYIQVKFGRKASITRSESTLKGRTERSSSQTHMWDVYRSMHTQKSPNQSNDHIRRNLVILSPASPIRRKEAKVKKRTIEQRRKSALTRKQSIVAEKRKRTFVLLHKHELRLLESEQNRAELALRSRRDNCCKDWIRLTANAKFLESTLERYYDKKRELALREQQRKAATKIQSHIRRVLKGSNGGQIACWYARNALLIYSRGTSGAFVEVIRKKLGEVLREAYDNSVVAQAIKRVMKLVVGTQRVWRKFGEQRAVRRENLSNFWQAVLEETLKHHSKSPKRLKKRRDLTQGYLHILPELKDKLLSQHMNASILRYRSELVAYITQQNELKSKGKPAFLEAVILAGSPLPPLPELRYLPSKEDMKKLIDKAAKETLKSQADVL